MLTTRELQAETSRLCNTNQTLLVERMNDLRDRALAIKATARQQGRVSTEAEDNEALSLFAESERIGAMPRTEPPRGDAIHYEGEPLASRASEFMDQNGRKIYALKPSEKLADLPLPGNQRFNPLSLGKAIIGLTTGKWEGARAEKLAMSEGGNAAGGYLVSEAFSKTVIDAARAKSQVVTAGAITVPWDNSDTLILARVASDPTFSVVAENTEIPPSQPSFDQVRFNALKIATVIEMSRELAEDSPNAAFIVEQTLVKAFAAELDRLALVGTAPNGLLTFSGVHATGSVGAITWEAIHAAKVAVETRNFTPNGYLCSPTIGGDLDMLTSGDGVTLAKTWLGAPPSLQRVPRYTTTNCPDANIFVGDWSQLAIGIRTNASLEVTSTGGNSFSKHQLLVKMVFRGDVAVLHSGAFEVLSGVTT